MQLFGHLDLAPTDVVMLFLLEAQMQKWERQQLAHRLLRSNPPSLAGSESGYSSGSFLFFPPPFVPMDPPPPGGRVVERHFLRLNPVLMFLGEARGLLAITHLSM